MATPARTLRSSLVPIFIARLNILMAIVPGLRELPQSHLDELRSLLERAQTLVEQAAGLPVTSESGSPPKL